MTERKNKIEQGNYNENIEGNYISITNNYFSETKKEEPQKNPDSMILSNIKQLIQEGDLKKATQQLLEFVTANSPRYENEVIVHKANVNKLIEKERRRITSEEKITQEKNSIMYALLDLIDAIQEEITKEQ